MHQKYIKTFLKKNSILNFSVLMVLLLAKNEICSSFMFDECANKINK